MTTREKITEFLSHERPGFEGGVLASIIAEAVDVAVLTVRSELRKMRAAGLAETVGETMENNRKAVLWGLTDDENPPLAAPVPDKARKAASGGLGAVPGASEDLLPPHFVPAGEASKAESTEAFVAAVQERNDGEREYWDDVIKQEKADQARERVAPDARLTEAEALEEAAALFTDGGPVWSAAIHWPGPEDGVVVTKAVFDPEGNRTVVESRPVNLARQQHDAAVSKATKAYADADRPPVADVPIHDAVAADLGGEPARTYSIGEMVEVFDQPYRLGDSPVYVGVGRVTATPAEDASLPQGEYRVKLPGVDVVEQGINGDVFDVSELRPVKVSA